MVSMAEPIAACRIRAPNLADIYSIAGAVGGCVGGQNRCGPETAEAIIMSWHYVQI